MEILEQKIELKNSCELIGKSKDIFSPIKEAITNSLDAIIQKQKLHNTFAPLISVCIYFKTSKDLLGKEIHALDYISIEDNGIGFTSDNLERFKKLAENTKGLNNRGTGKIQIFCRFNEISIDSTFIEDGKGRHLNAIWKITGEYDDSLTELGIQNITKTIVKMSDFSGDKNEENFFLRYLDNINELRRDIVKRFLLRLWLGTNNNSLSLRIQTFLENQQKGDFTFNQSTVPHPDKEEVISISTEQAKVTVDKKNKDKVHIDWRPIEPKYNLILRRFKLSKDEVDENGIYMCSKDIVVEPFKFQAVRKNANFNGYRYLSSISGDILDNPLNVNQSVDGFKFPSKKKIERELKDGDMFLFNRENKFIFWDEIKDKIGHGLSEAYDDIEGLQGEREKTIIELAKQYGISLEDAEESNIAFNDTEEEATEKLFETQAKRLAKQSIEIQKTYKELKDLGTQILDPRSEEYRIKFGELSNKLLEKIPQQNKDELTRYIIRRDMVVDLLKLALCNDLAVQKEWQEKKGEGEKIRQDKEGIIHDIIFKRRMKEIPNDLWILNEEFVHFNGCSDLELDKLEINGEKILKDNIDILQALRSVGIQKDTYSKQRPDIFLFPEEGKCILVEFKAPDVDVSTYLDQIQRYARLLANYSNKQFIQFFGFLIGETIDRVSVPGRYNKVPYGNYWIYPDEPVKSIDESEIMIANLYQEILPLSEIVKRAELRNRSFAEKLGITRTDLSRIREEINT